MADPLFPLTGRSTIPVDRTKARDMAYALRTGAGGSHPAADVIEHLCDEVEHGNAEIARLRAELTAARTRGIR